MKPVEQKIIFLNSYLPRTGHNFASEVIKIFSDHKVLIHNKSETRLSRMLNAYYDIYDKSIIFETDKAFFDKLFINDLRDRILEESNRGYAMIKDTTLVGTPALSKAFPNDIHLILIRDPQSVYNSLIKGMSLTNPTFKNTLKKLGKKTGIYPWYYSRKVSRQILKEIPNLKKHQIIRYEDLVLKDESTLKNLQKLFSTEKDLDQIKKEIDEIKVINSSFFEEVKAKKIWDAQPKTKEFDPVNRKGNSWLIRKGIEIGSRKLRKRLNYI